jgi:hypothetical protein
MDSIFFEVIALGLSIALSPTTIIVAILIVLSPHGRAGGIGFLIGWVSGLTIMVLLLLQAANPAGIRSGERSSEDWVGFARLGLGCIILILGLIRWRDRKPETPATLPGWTRMIDRLNPWIALGVGIVWAGPSPKNAALLASATASIVEAGLSDLQQVLLVVVLVTSASLGVAIPVIWAVVSGERASRRLTQWREWLTANNAAITALIFSGVGALLIVKALGDIL